MFGGKRASDRKVPAPALPTRDRALEQAIRRDRIELRFQPQIEPASGRIAGVEALARWDGAKAPKNCSPAPKPPGLPSGCRGRSSARRCAPSAAGAGRSPGLRLSINLLPRDLDRAGL